MFPRKPPKSLFLGSLAAIPMCSGICAIPEVCSSNDWQNQHRYKPARPSTRVEEYVRAGEAFYCTCCACRSRHSRLRRNSPEQQEHRGVHLLSGNCHPCIAAEGESPGHYRHAFGEFPFHPDRSARTQLYRDPDFGGGLDGGSMSFPRSPSSHTTYVQCLRRLHFDDVGIRRIPPSTNELSCCEPSNSAWPFRNRIFHCECRFHSDSHFVD